MDALNYLVYHHDESIWQVYCVDNSDPRYVNKRSLVFQGRLADCQAWIWLTLNNYIA